MPLPVMPYSQPSAFCHRPCHKSTTASGFLQRGSRMARVMGSLVALPVLGFGWMGAAIATPASTADAVPIAQANAARPTLRLGSEGPAVAELQGMLVLLGYYPGAVDGAFTDATEAAVRDFQSAAGLTSDGIVGPATWSRLLPTPSTEFTPPAAPATGGDEPEPDPSAAADDPPAAESPAAGDAAPTTAAVTSPVELPTLRVGMYGPAVIRVQERLQRLDFYTGALDGVFGPQTEAAVKAFQRSRQLNPDGVIGPVTWQALLR
jgi:N-acetylmuramoyl-L-alanine amidase